jgi:hypothetical protein
MGPPEPVFWQTAGPFTVASDNTQTMLARTIATSTDYRKAGNEAHALIRTELPPV